jgi:hypothetical protein
VGHVHQGQDPPDLRENYMRTDLDTVFNAPFWRFLIDCLHLMMRIMECCFHQVVRRPRPPPAPLHRPWARRGLTSASQV